ncbi:ankyrin repeats (many copies) domain-containing protein [Hirsutella rhossiliensis]|uniref:Ankyrin repeats (Many copies) domain-containing protein n=1 Tax=Hirsutella rhossiliensis TaxID=111463 RepID=A0A9P8N651_9HYPO|nr:ankyrin repeats (many copies) domain-containing protein [Hirsutella rhossiliensis]KAH0968353.1 ankyrin repeats (many copies) domain-containing protein [Hirsutella rhossiliensis]
MAHNQNPFLLAADNSPELLPLLRDNPALASAQDEHGYSLVHAAASYNHLDLLRALVHEFHVNINIVDEDNETALFVVETVGAARVLVEELSADVRHRSSEGLTAAGKIEAEGDFPAVAAYLTGLGSSTIEAGEPVATTAVPDIMNPPPIEGMDFTLGTLDQTVDIPTEVDPEFRRRIEELAQRDDFNTPQGQSDLRKLVEDALMDQGLGEERNVRSKRA